MAIEEIDLGKKNLNPGDLENLDGGQKDPNAGADPEEKNGKGEDKGDGSKKKVEYTPRETQLYNRAKDAEEDVKKYREKFGQLDGQNPKKEPEVPSKESQIDPFSLAKTVASLKDYDAEEIDFASTISKVKGISPELAVKTPDFKLWLAGKRDQDYKNNKVPTPGGAGGSDPSIPSEEEIGNMTKEQHQKLEKDFISKKRNKGSGL